MVDLFTIPQLTPFAVALGLVLLFLMVEVIGLLVGFSSFDDGDIDLEFDTDVDVDFDIDADLSRAFGEPDIDIDVVGDTGGIWTFLELGRVPMLVWIISMAGGFAMAGYGIQLLLSVVFGFMLPAIFAVVAALVPAVFVGKFFVELFATIAPKSSTQAISRRSLGGSIGVVSVGTAQNGNPAPATVKDRFGNSHNIRVVPFDGEPALPQGTSIVVLTGGEDGVFWALSLENAKQRFNKT